MSDEQAAQTLFIVEPPAPKLLEVDHFIAIRIDGGELKKQHFVARLVAEHAQNSSKLVFVDQAVVVLIVLIEQVQQKLVTRFVFCHCRQHPFSNIKNRAYSNLGIAKSL